MRSFNLNVTAHLFVFFVMPVLAIGGFSQPVTAGQPPVVSLPATVQLETTGVLQLDLNRYVSDPDTPEGELTWAVYYVLGDVQATLVGSSVTLTGQGSLPQEPAVVFFSVHDRENRTEDSIEIELVAQLQGALQLPGDCNQDGALGLSDAVCTLGVLFTGNPSSFPCGSGAASDPANVTLMDWQGDASVGLSDAVSMLGYLFNGGPSHVLGTTCTAIVGCPDGCGGGSPGTPGDQDSDGVPDSEESSQKSSKHYPDSDGDGVLDSLDPHPAISPWPQPFLDSLDSQARDAYRGGHVLHLYSLFYRGQFLADADRDGIADAEEEVAGADGYVTDPRSPDTDGDGLSDGGEVSITGTDPNQQDSESDGDGDGMVVYLEADAGTDLQSPDTDSDGLSDGEETNADNESDTTLTAFKDSSGNTKNSVTFGSGGGKETVYTNVPVSDYALEYVTSATVTLSGQSVSGSLPSGVLVDVGADWTGFTPGPYGWVKPIVRVDHRTRGAFPGSVGGEGIAQSFKVLQDVDVRGFAVLMEFFSTGSYDYGLQDSSGNWLTNFPRTHTVNAATGFMSLISFAFGSEVQLTQGTEYRLAVVEQNDLGDVPFGYTTLVGNSYPYGRRLVGANSLDAGGWNPSASSATEDLAFHVFQDLSTGIDTYDIAAGFNEYLATHSDGDDGLQNGFVRVPVDIHSASEGRVDFSNVKIEVKILLTNPNQSDSDGDGLADGWDDSDADGLKDAGEDDGEQQYATNPTDQDTDGDGEGLSDFDEVTYSYDVTVPDESASFYAPDPLRPELLLEVDAMSGYKPSDAVFFETQQAFQEIGVTLRYQLDDLNLTAVDVQDSNDTQKENILSQNDDYTAPYLHVIFAKKSTASGSLFGQTHYLWPNEGSNPNNPDPKFAGVFVFRQGIDDYHNDHKSDLENLGITKALMTARTTSHEIGHAVGCTHESTYNGFNYHNLMTKSGALGDPAQNSSRWEQTMFGPDDAGPRFSAGSALQMDLSFKASVETTIKLDIRKFDCGTSSSAVHSQYVQVLKSHVHDSSKPFGWESGMTPDQASQNGGSSSQSRTRDICEHSQDGSDVRFRIGGLGRYQLFSIKVGLGKGSSTAITQDMTVRARILGATTGSFSQVTIQDPSEHRELTFSSVVPFPDGTIVVDFTDAYGSGTDPAPIEYIRVEKRFP